MAFTPYQIVVPLLSLFVVSYAWHLVYLQKKTIWEGILWTIFWGVIAFIAVFPDSLRFLTELTGIRRYENALLMTSIGILFFMMFYLVIRIEEVEQRLTKTLRKEALDDLKDGDS